MGTWQFIEVANNFVVVVVETTKDSSDMFLVKSWFHPF